MECCGRPNRSDVHLTRDEEAKIEEETREYFDGIAPKRHSKPLRSEYSSNYVDALPCDDANKPMPELVEFRRLEDNTQVCVLPNRHLIDLKRPYSSILYLKSFSASASGILKTETDLRWKSSGGGICGDCILRGSQLRRQAAPPGE